MARPDSKKAPHQTTEKQEQTVRNAFLSPPVQGQSDSQNSLYPEENLKISFSEESLAARPWKSVKMFPLTLLCMVYAFI